MSGKLNKIDADYHIAKAGQDHCAECKWFLPPAACEWIGGQISPQGWCRLYHEKHRGSALPRKQDADRAYVRQMREAH